jgi:ABC-type antimicrobial peptide transport system permease subunit
MYGSLLFNDILNDDPAIKSSQSLIVMAAVGILIFSVIFLTYTGIYFIKSRGKEFGVYLTLGMTTRDLSRMVILESFILSIISSLIGILSGLLFSKIFYLALGKILALDKDLFFINYKAYLLSLGVFLLIFIFNMTFANIYIRRMSIVEITKSSKTRGISNQKPIVGIIALIVLAASMWLFNAIVKGHDLVIDFVREYPILAPCMSIAGILFSLFFVIGSGIAAVSFILKKFPTLYNKNLLLLSGLSHRFLSYRVTLYSVSMLITMAIFFIGIGMSFYNYTDMTIDDFQPYDFMIERRGDINVISEQEITELVQRNGGEIESFSTFSYLDSQTYRELHDRDGLFVNYRTTGYVLKESEYNSHMNQNISLETDELMLVYNQIGFAEQFADFDTLLDIEPFWSAIARADEYRDKGWDKDTLIKTIENSQSLNYMQDKTSRMFGTFINSYGNIEFAGAMASVIDDSVFEAVKGEQYNEILLFNLKSGDDQKIFEALLSELKQKNIENGIINEENADTFWASSAIDFYDKDDITQLRPISKAERYEICFRANGFLLFALAFLGLLFLVSSCIVLYYKLVTDTDEEAEQVDLLKKLGLTVRECRSYLQTHIAIIFFAPLLFGGMLGLYLVDNFVSFTSYRTVLVSRVAIMYGAVVLLDILLYFSLRKRFFNDVRL